MCGSLCGHREDSAFAGTSEQEVVLTGAHLLPSLFCLMLLFIDCTALGEPGKS